MGNKTRWQIREAIKADNNTESTSISSSFIQTPDLLATVAEISEFTASNSQFTNLSSSLINATQFSASNASFPQLKFGSSPNELHLDNQGYMRLSGSSTCWNDFMILANDLRVNGVQGTEPPTYAKVAFDATRGTDWSGLFAYQFTYGANTWRDANFTVQIPHDYAVGTRIYPHVHCRLDVNDANQVGNKMLLEFEYIWKNVNEAGKHNNASNNTNIITWNFTITSASIDSDNFIIEVPNGIFYASASISSVIYGRLSRIVKNASWAYPVLTGGLVNDNFNGTFWLSSIDFHYEVDSLGSREEYIK